MPEKKRILFINQELEPYLPPSPAATFSRDLAVAVHGKGCEVRTFIPRYGAINERRNQLHEVIRLSGANIAINDTDHPLILKVASLPPSRIQVYFIDNDDFFQKEDADSDTIGSNRKDNDERMIFYARGTAETVRKLKWDPHLVQAAGWMTSLFPLYMRLSAKESPAMSRSKVVYAVTAEKPDSPLDGAFISKLREDGLLDDKSVEEAVLSAPDDITLLHRLGILGADAVIFLTPEPDEALVEFARSRGIPVKLSSDLGEGKEKLENLKEFYRTLQES